MSKRSRSMWEMQEIIGSVDTARVLMLLAQQSQHHHHHSVVAQPVAVRDAADRVFVCKTCNRQFPTFQALGGHRASHKRPRQQQHQHAFSAGADDAAGLCLGRHPTPSAQQQQPAKPRVYECLVCGLEFPIGQALGGHMRRHRAEAEATAKATNVDVGKAAPAVNVKACDGGGVCLDLNLTPSENCAKCRNVVGLGGSAGQGGVHKALAMLDCFL